MSPLFYPGLRPGLIQYVINEALENAEEGVKAGGVRIPAVRFADDQAMVSHTVRGLQIIIDALQKKI